MSQKGLEVTVFIKEEKRWVLLVCTAGSSP
jgi:hypothetical protein